MRPLRTWGSTFLHLQSRPCYSLFPVRVTRAVWELVEAPGLRGPQGQARPCWVPAGTTANTHATLAKGQVLPYSKSPEHNMTLSGPEHTRQRSQQSLVSGTSILPQLTVITELSAPALSSVALAPAGYGFQGEAEVVFNVNK